MDRTCAQGVFRVLPPPTVLTIDRGIASSSSKSNNMVSLILQERILGATLGGLLMGGFVFQQRMAIYRSISDDGSKSKFSYVPKDHLFGSISEVDLGHLWNKSVDGTLGPVIKYLSSHGW